MFGKRVLVATCAVVAMMFAACPARADNFMVPLGKSRSYGSFRIEIGVDQFVVEQGSATQTGLSPFDPAANTVNNANTAIRLPSSFLFWQWTDRAGEPLTVFNGAEAVFYLNAASGGGARLEEVRYAIGPIDYNDRNLDRKLRSLPKAIWSKAGWAMMPGTSRLSPGSYVITPIARVKGARVDEWNAFIFTFKFSGTESQNNFIPFTVKPYSGPWDPLTMAVTMNDLRCGGEPFDPLGVRNALNERQCKAQKEADKKRREEVPQTQATANPVPSPQTPPQATLAPPTTQEPPKPPAEPEKSEATGPVSVRVVVVGDLCEGLIVKFYDRGNLAYKYVCHQTSFTRLEVSGRDAWQCSAVNTFDRAEYTCQVVYDSVAYPVLGDDGSNIVLRVRPGVESCTVRFRRGR